VLEDLCGGGGAPDIHRIAPFIVGVFVVLLYKIGREVSRFLVKLIGKFLGGEKNAGDEVDKRAKTMYNKTRVVMLRENTVKELVYGKAEYDAIRGMAESFEADACALAKGGFGNASSRNYFDHERIG
jgi:hypothetical protein